MDEPEAFEQKDNFDETDQGEEIILEVSGESDFNIENIERLKESGNGKHDDLDDLDEITLSEETVVKTKQGKKRTYSKHYKKILKCL